MYPYPTNVVTYPFNLTFLVEPIWVCASVWKINQAETKFYSVLYVYSGRLLETVCSRAAHALRIIAS